MEKNSIDLMMMMKACGCIAWICDLRNMHQKTIALFFSNEETWWWNNVKRKVDMDDLLKKTTSNKLLTQEVES